ncbi:potassium channel family protein [Algicola sagamiensis]|uniref:potassium channel family protein n=1 Tax=Algicola sagamiensis TaxID=163869 RepID=UPI0003680C46|nr:potassium channel family protein [Algicola sagamiensis]
MNILRKFLLAMRLHLNQVTWPALIMIVLFHALSTWGLLFSAQETAILEPITFLYYYIVTTSTVGFGDFSPQSPEGRLVVSLWQIPLGLAIFGAFLGKTGQAITHLLRRNMTGEKDYQHYEDHILIFGWHNVRTRRIIEHILGDSKREQRRILLCVTDDMTHPLIDQPSVSFAKLETFTDQKCLDRIAVTKAARIIIDGRDDDQTFTTALRVSTLVADECHISAHFQDETKVEMLKQHCRNVECTSSKTAEILVRSMQDPGSSLVHEQLLSTLHGHTQFSLVVPEEVPNEGLKFSSVFYHLKDRHNMTILAVAKNRFGEGIHLNPPGDHLIQHGMTLHYICKERIFSHEIDWLAITA